MIHALAQPFILGFRDGWTRFWWPFTAPIRIARANRARRRRQARSEPNET